MISSHVSAEQKACQCVAMGGILCLRKIGSSLDFDIWISSLLRGNLAPPHGLGSLVHPAIQNREADVNFWQQGFELPVAIPAIDRTFLPVYVCFLESFSSLSQDPRLLPENVTANHDPLWGLHAFPRRCLVRDDTTMLRWSTDRHRRAVHWLANHDNF